MSIIVLRAFNSATVTPISISQTFGLGPFSCRTFHGNQFSTEHILRNAELAQPHIYRQGNRGPEKWLTQSHIADPGLESLSGLLTSSIICEDYVYIKDRLFIPGNFYLYIIQTTLALKFPSGFVYWYLHHHDSEQ